MKVSRKLILAAGAMVLPFASLAMVGVGSASAARPGQVTGSGLVKCTKISGTITFSPPLVNGGTAAETTTVVAKATVCSGGSPNPTTVNSTATITGGNNSCAGLATAAPPTLAGTYLPAGSLNPSSTSGGTESLQTTPYLGFTISNATTTGSFPSTTTDIVVQTKTKEGVFLKDCKTKKGFKKFKIGKGSVTNL